MTTKHNLGPALADTNPAASAAVVTARDAAYLACSQATQAALETYRRGGSYATYAAAVASAEATRAAALDPGAIISY